MTALGVSVDLRIRFEKDQIKDGVSVAIVHIDTDSKPEIWFQMSRGEVDYFLQKLSETAAQMDAADCYLRLRCRRRDDV